MINLFPACPYPFPKDVTSYMLSYLTPRERITTICLLSLAWKEVVYDEKVWELLYAQHFGKRLKPDICYRQLYQITSDALPAVHDFLDGSLDFVISNHSLKINSLLKKRGIWVQYCTLKEYRTKDDLIRVFCKFDHEKCTYSIRLFDEKNFYRLVKCKKKDRGVWPDIKFPKEKVTERLKIIEKLINNKLKASIYRSSQNYYKTLIDVEDFTKVHYLHIRNRETMVIHLHHHAGANVNCQIQLQNYMQGERLKWDFVSWPSNTRETSIIRKAMNRCIDMLMKNHDFVNTLLKSTKRGSYDSFRSYPKF